MIRDESHLTVRPNVCSAERLDGRIATRGSTPVFLDGTGRVFWLGEGEPTERGPVTATVVVLHGGLPRAYDVKMGDGSR